MSTSWWTTPETPLIGQHTIGLLHRLPHAMRRRSNLMRWVIWLACERAGRLPHNEGYSTMPPRLAGFRARCGDLRIDARRVLSKLRLGRSGGSEDAAAAARRRQGRPTYRGLLSDLLDAAQMRTAFLYDGTALRAYVDRPGDRPIGSLKTLDSIVAIEIIGRAAGQLRC